MSLLIKKTLVQGLDIFYEVLPKSLQHFVNVSKNEINVFEANLRAKEINSVSPSFCSAKWLQETLLLQNGYNHSCHHPPQHKVPVEEIKNNPSALHNTSFKKEQRKLMIEGKRPEECQYCWNIEDLSRDHVSDRIYKSTNLEWAYPFLNKVRETSSDQDINPTYLEVSFDNTCNFKCAYCTPDISTTWMDEVKKHGPYPTSHKTGNTDWLKDTGRYPYHHSEDNPYVEAFWKWWPSLVRDLRVFRITGGEPLLSQNTWKVLSYLNESPQKELKLAINTNMGVREELIDKLINQLNNTYHNIKSFELFTSCEAHGDKAEYIRYGLNYKNFINNIERFLEKTPPSVTVNIMVTFNLLSVTSFLDFLLDIGRLRKKFAPHQGQDRIPIMISYLRWPPFLNVVNLDLENKKKFYDEFMKFCEKYSYQNSETGFLYLEEIDQIKRLCDFMMTDLNETELEINRVDFYKFIEEYDKRKNLNFHSVFPELNDYFLLCKDTMR